MHLNARHLFLLDYDMQTSIYYILLRCRPIHVVDISYETLLYRGIIPPCDND